MAMTEADDIDFTEFLMEKAREAKAKLNYYPGEFLKMLGSQRGYATTLHLLSKKDASQGFTRLWEKKRLDLTVEALVLESKWRMHFDPVLQEIAMKRLLAHEYFPKTYIGPTATLASPEPSTARAVAVSPTLALTVHWKAWVETIPLQLDALGADDWLQTVEARKDGSEPTTYEAKRTAATTSADGTWHFELLYDGEHGTNKDIAKQFPELKWGTTKITIAPDLTSATATYYPDGGISFECERCLVVNTTLYATLTRAQANVLLRPGQAKLRAELLKTYGRCAISNERAADALEAAHIIDHCASGSATIQNSLLLRADLHALYDVGKLQISTTGAITLIGLSADSHYHASLSQRWNKKLPEKTLENVKAALEMQIKRA